MGINANRSTETQVFRMYSATDGVNSSHFYDMCQRNPHYQPRNRFEASVNPQDSTETRTQLVAKKTDSILFRFHDGGTVYDSLSKAVEVRDMDDLKSVIRKNCGNCGVIEVKPYGYDSRIDWDTQIVTSDGKGIGYLSGPFEKPVTIDLRAKSRFKRQPDGSVHVVVPTVRYIRTNNRVIIDNPLRGIS